MPFRIIHIIPKFSLFAPRKYDCQRFRFCDIRVIEYCTLNRALEALSAHPVVTPATGELLDALTNSCVK